MLTVPAMPTSGGALEIPPSTMASQDRIYFGARMLIFPVESRRTRAPPIPRRTAGENFSVQGLAIGLHEPVRGNVQIPEQRHLGPGNTCRGR